MSSGNSSCLESESQASQKSKPRLCISRCIEALRRRVPVTWEKRRENVFFACAAAVVPRPDKRPGIDSRASARKRERVAIQQPSSLRRARTHTLSTQSDDTSVEQCIFHAARNDVSVVQNWSEDPGPCKKYLQGPTGLLRRCSKVLAPCKVKAGWSPSRLRPRQNR